MSLADLLATIKQDSAVEMYAEVRDGVIEGEINPLQMLVGIKLLSDALDSLRTSIMPFAVSELQKYGIREVPLFGALLTVKDAGVTWDFKVCENKDWEACKLQESEIAGKRKQIETILKKFYENPFITEFVDEESAEVIERPPSAPVRKSTTIAQVEFPKPKKEKK